MKKPWNRTDHPVFAVSTFDGVGEHNMHIATYITAISMRPKQYIVGIYHGTKTRALLDKHPSMVIQLLGESQGRLIDLLGRNSGFTTDKIGRLRKRGLLTSWLGFEVLSSAVFRMKLDVVGCIEAGDHTAFLCEVKQHKNLSDEAPLTLDYLRAKKLIRN
jgi:flavin reductase (DIM6/NTAB) family NADH-FMN oxidoreductase RutF